MRDEPPLVSVIIPAWNAAHSLRDAVNGVLAQTWPARELIVVDDGSTDGTCDVARAYGDEVTLISRAHGGPGAARNAGLARARGDYVAFLDADDYWAPPFLERTAGFLASHPAAVAVLTAWTRIRAGGGREIVPPCVARAREPTAPCVLDSLLRFWVDQNHVQTGAILLRRSAVEKAGPMREDLPVSQDLEYWLLLSTVGPWGFLPEPLFFSNSRAGAARAGWLARYAERRRLCPDVDTWESRLAARIRPGDRAWYEIIRGRVAAGFMHHMIVAGRNAEARELMERYGAAMPVSPVTRVLSAGRMLGEPGWRVACALVRARERVKDRSLRRAVRAAARERRA